MKFRRVCVVICSWLRCTSLAVKSSSCSWSSMPTRPTYSTGLWIAATQAPTSSPQAASKLSLQSVAAGIKSDNVSVVCSPSRRSAACAHFLLCSHIHLFFVVFVIVPFHVCSYVMRCYLCFYHSITQISCPSEEAVKLA